MSERQTKAGNWEFSKVNVCEAVTFRKRSHVRCQMIMSSLG